MKRRYIALRELKNLEACEEACQAFAKKFGRRATLKAVIKRIRRINEPSWESWLLSQNIPLTKAALENGANINVDGGSAIVDIMCYAGGNKLSFIKFLIEHGINMNPAGSKALSIALDRQDSEVAAYLLQNGANPLGEMLSNCVRSGFVNGVYLLLAYKSKIEEIPEANKLLGIAVRAKNADITQLIFKHFPMDNISSDNINDLFKYIVNYGNFYIAKILRDNGARIV